MVHEQPLAETDRSSGSVRFTPRGSNREAGNLNPYPNFSLLNFDQVEKFEKCMARDPDIAKTRDQHARTHGTSLGTPLDLGSATKICIPHP